MSRQLIPVISLFCGPGGMDLGFRRQGFTPILAIDVDHAAVATYNKNGSRKIARQGDLSVISDAEIIRIVRESIPHNQRFGVIGGPPCQGFSVSNVHKKRKDPRKTVLLRYAQILKVLNDEFTVDFFVFENVAGLISTRHKYHLSKVRRAFKSAGFNIFEQQLDASMFGVPQRRRRFFIVGINKQLYPGIKFEFPAGDSEIPITVRETIGNLPKPAYFKRGIKRKEIPYHPNHWTMNPKSLKLKNGTSPTGRSFRKLKWNQPSWTVAYGNREIHVHPRGGRRISIFEAMLLQGFPKSFELRGNFTQQVNQVSDAVPPPLASAVAKSVRIAMYNRIANIQRDLLVWFEKNRRSFPWRKTKDPYKILLAEKLLQQTAAKEHVVAAYKEILSLYPTIEALAKARVSDLRRIISPLGFVYRAEELPRLAQEILKRHGGELPRDLKLLLALPGIGDYSARAILSFAYGQDLPVVDTNIARLLYRIFGISKPMPSNPARNRQLLEMAAVLVPLGKSKDFNLAALDLCAAVCTVRQPNCPRCPIRHYCDYGQAVCARNTENAA